MENSSLTTLKTKVRAFQNMEKVIGQNKINLDSLQRNNRKEAMRKYLVNQISENIANFDYPEMHTLLNKFFEKLKIPQSLDKIEIQPLPKDMFIKIDKKTLILEEEFIKNTSLEMVKVVIFHELYHKFGQNMEPNMKEVKYLTDYFGFNSIVELDIDADVETFKFLNLEFEKYLQLLYQNLPSDPNWRIPKITRLTGSILSIYISQKYDQKVVLMPELTDNSQNYIACITNGRKFAKSSFLKNLARICCNSSNFTQIGFAKSITILCQEISQELEPQLLKDNSKITKT